MLEYLHLRNVGPAPEMSMKVAPRLNLITGDNGLGKSFLLDIAWWVLTRTWARMKVIPPSASERMSLSNPRNLQPPFKRTRAKPESAIGFGYRTASKKPVVSESIYSRSELTWPLKPGRPSIPGLVLYGQVDGGFSAWDPARNSWKENDSEPPVPPAAYRFKPDEAWDGLPMDSPKKLCNGLILDWASWQKENGDAFRQLTRVLGALSPSPEEPLKPGKLTRIALNDTRDQPTLATRYGQDVPLVLGSAGMRRVAALAYMLVWTWQEHLRACEIRGTRPANQIIFLIDEIEAHLHPQWQRRIVKALLHVMEALTESDSVSVQLIATTHSPLILASAEPILDSEKDAWFDLDLHQTDGGGRVQLEKRYFVRHGDVSNWLTSEAFDLKEPRSIEGEEAVQRARALLRQKELPTLKEARAVDDALRKAGLPDIDPFWVRWGAYIEEIGVKDDSGRSGSASMGFRRARSKTRA
jgi:hypothetical protein